MFDVRTEQQVDHVLSVDVDCSSNLRCYECRGVAECIKRWSVNTSMYQLHEYCVLQNCTVESTCRMMWSMRKLDQSTAASSASCKRSRPPSNLVNGQELTMCDIVWISAQSHSSLSVKLHFLWHALQWPWPVRKRFSSDHWRLWRSKLGSWIVGSTTVAVRWLQVMELSEQLTQFQERLLDQTEEVQHANTQLEQARQERDKLNAAHKQQIQQLISERDHFQVSL